MSLYNGHMREIEKEAYTTKFIVEGSPPRTIRDLVPTLDWRWPEEYIETQAHKLGFSWDGNQWIVWRNAERKQAAKARRNVAVTMRREGSTLGDIGIHLGVTRERVRQIIKAEERAEVLLKMARVETIEASVRQLTTKQMELSMLEEWRSHIAWHREQEAKGEVVR